MSESTVPGPLLTEPLPLSILADEFECDARVVRRELQKIPGVVRFGNLWRVPLHAMPPGYLLATGLLVPRAVEHGTSSFDILRAEGGIPLPDVAASDHDSPA